jgi:hypothetical protein
MKGGVGKKVKKDWKPKKNPPKKILEELEDDKLNRNDAKLWEWLSFNLSFERLANMIWELTMKKVSFKSVEIIEE